MWTIRSTMGICSVAAAMTMLVSGCVTKPTIDLTKAPFKASTDLSQAPLRASTELTGGTTDATARFTEPTTDFTLSTSPRSWFDQNGLLKSEYKLMAFAAWNFENLREDLAQGQGEYLTSYATLLGVPEAQRVQFYARAQSRYDSLFGETISPVDAINLLIHDPPL